MSESFRSMDNWFQRCFGGHIKKSTKLQLKIWTFPLKIFLKSICSSFIVRIPSLSRSKSLKNNIWFLIIVCRMSQKMSVYTACKRIFLGHLVLLKVHAYQSWNGLMQFCGKLWPLKANLNCHKALVHLIS